MIMKRLIWLALLLLATGIVFGTAGSFTFSSGIDTYTEIAGGIVAGSGTIDNTNYPVALPWPFTFNGTAVTMVLFSSNGYLAFNTTNNFSYTAVSSTAVGLGCAAVLSADLKGNAGGEMMWNTFDAAPNRYYVFQWKDWNKYNNTSYPTQSWGFQVIIYEATNDIKFRYNNFATTTWTGTVQVGLRGTTNTDFNNRTTATDWSATVRGSSNTDTCILSPTVYPGSGQFFQLAAPTTPVCVISPSSKDFGTVVTGTTVSQSFLVTNGGSGTLTITGVSISGSAYYTLFWVPTFPIGLSEQPGVGLVAGFYIHVNFTPTVAGGPYTATVTVTGDYRVDHVIPLTGSAADETTKIIGTGTSTSQYPFNTSYAYTRNASLYTADEMGTYGAIDRVGWNCSLASSAAIPYNIYLKATNSTSLLPDTWANMTSGATLVKSGTYTFSTIGWHYFDLTTEFDYFENNLLVLLEINLGTTASTPYFYSTSTSPIAKSEEWHGNTIPSFNGGLYYQRSDLEIPFHAFTHPIFCITPGEYDFGYVSIYSSESKEIVIKNSGSGNLLINAISLVVGSDPEFTLSGIPSFPQELGEGGTMSFAVVFAPIYEGGPCEALVRILSDARVTHEVALTGYGYDEFDIEFGDSGLSNSGTSYPCPYGDYDKNARQQYLVTSAELAAAGVSPGAHSINSVAFNVNATNGCANMLNYRVRLKQTTQPGLTNIFEPGTYTQVWQSNSFTPVVGWNTHAFPVPFIWDGVSNLLIDAIFDMGTFTYNASVYYTPTLNITSLDFHSDTAEADDALTGNPSCNRANMLLNITEAPTAPVFHVYPAEKDFGAVSINTTVSQLFTVSNSGIGTLNVNWVWLDPGSPEFYSLTGLPAFPQELASGSYFTFTVNFFPVSPGGPFTGTVFLMSDYRPDYSIALTGSCYDPMITVFPYTQPMTPWPPTDWNLTGGTQSVINHNTGTNDWAEWHFFSWASGSTAYLTSPPIYSNNPLWLSFLWSHLYSSGYPLDALTVQYSLNGTTWTDLWTRSGAGFNSGDGATVTAPGTGVAASFALPVDIISSPFRLRFNGHSGYGQDVFIDNITLTEILPVPLPFYEDWATLSYGTQYWTPEGNWVTPSDGYAEFSRNPNVMNYNYALTSKVITAGTSTAVRLRFDLCFSNYSSGTLEQMEVEVGIGGLWLSVAHFDNVINPTGFDWTRFVYDISGLVAGLPSFQIRFRAHGLNSQDINYWQLDNVLVDDIATPAVVSPVSISLVDGIVTISWWSAFSPYVDWYNIYISHTPEGPWTLYEPGVRERGQTEYPEILTQKNFSGFNNSRQHQQGSSGYPECLTSDLPTFFQVRAFIGPYFARDKGR